MFVHLGAVSSDISVESGGQGAGVEAGSPGQAEAGQQVGVLLQHVLLVVAGGEEVKIGVATKQKKTNVNIVNAFAGLYISPG